MYQIGREGSTLPTTHFSLEPFGEFSTPLRSSAVGTPITLYTLANSAFIESGGRAGLCASVTDLGATVQSILVPDREGRLADVALGFDSGQEYLAPQPYVGCTVGRVANRIGGGRFSNANPLQEKSDVDFIGHAGSTMHLNRLLCSQRAISQLCRGSRRAIRDKGTAAGLPA